MGWRAVRVSIALVVVTAAVACSGSGPEAGGGGAGRDPDPAAFWPVDAGSVALLAGADGLVLTDGRHVEDLGLGAVELPSAVGGDDVGLAIALYEELVTVDLRDGTVHRRECAGCSGVAVVDDRIVTVLPDFTLHVFDRDLGLVGKVPVEQVTEPRTVDHPPEPSMPTVIGTVGDTVAVSYLTTNGGARGGPDVISLYGLDGTHEHHWTVDGRTYGAATSGDGRTLAVAIGGSAGACNNQALPVLLERGRDQPQVLVTDAEEGPWYWADDVWWNGDEVVTVGLYNSTHDAGCSPEAAVRRFVGDEEGVPIPLGEVMAHRLFGSGCDRAVRVDDTVDGPEAVITDGEATTVVDGVSAVAWSAPLEERCPELVGLDGG